MIFCYNFHQQIKAMERRYKVFLDEATMGVFMWDELIVHKENWTKQTCLSFLLQFKVYISRKKGNEYERLTQKNWNPTDTLVKYIIDCNFCFQPFKQ